jgi:GTP-binding protein
LVLLTKADKLNRQEANKALSITRLQAGGGEVKLFSALKKQGVGEVAHLLWQWTHPSDVSEKPTEGIDDAGSGQARAPAPPPTIDIDPDPDRLPHTP